MKCTAAGHLLVLVLVPTAYALECRPDCRKGKCTELGNPHLECGSCPQTDNFACHDGLPSFGKKAAIAGGEAGSRGKSTAGALPNSEKQNSPTHPKCGVLTPASGNACLAHASLMSSACPIHVQPMPNACLTCDAQSVTRTPSAFTWYMTRVIWAHCACLERRQSARSQQSCRV